MKNIISQEWLKDNISKEDLIILDTRAELNDPNYGLNEYEKGHIKGAHFVPMEEITTGELREHGGRHPLPDMNEFIENMKSFGIKDDSTVIIYDDGDLAMAGRLWWILKYSGKHQVYILEGGIKSWVENGMEVTTEIPKVKKSDILTLNLDSSMEVDIDYVKEAIGNKDVVIIDSRAYERYIGEVEPLDKIPGHIPNALNYPWMNLVENGLKSKEELEEYFKPLKDYREVIVHCGSGITGTVNLMFMEEIGLKPKFYVGGYSDWVSYGDNEVVEGDK
ncbi:sulfurtransferase [Tissierella pigra]|uniref:Sulfurtransferase n=1 Tax=Tissierella pigra TaxID=2607614 RepID=A0A6N7XES4_9FIRM|nr:sulfurtransferase [Tissierella pigra]MSU00489.1 sulfurtransferase [Tissierella pigra]